jgi:hypothetical protein
MTSSESIRASDADREVVVATLRDAYTAGRLTLDEFDERTTQAYASKTWGDLRRLTNDLPTQPVLGADVPGRQVPPPPQLPVPPPLLGPPPSRHRGSGRPIAFLPVLMLLVIAIATRSGALLAPALVALLVLAMMSGARHR